MKPTARYWIGGIGDRNISSTSQDWCVRLFYYTKATLDYLFSKKGVVGILKLDILIQIRKLCLDSTIYDTSRKIILISKLIIYANYNQMSIITISFQ